LKPGRLLILSPTTARGGAEDYMLTVADAAAAAGWDLTVSIESRTGTSALVSELESRPHVTYVDARVGDDETAHRLAFAQQARAASSVVRRVRPDVAMVVLPWPTHGLGTLLALARSRIPTALVFQLAPWEMPLGALRRLYRLAQRRGQRLVAVSEQNRDALASTFAVPREEIRTIYNGVAPQAAPSRSEVAANREAVRRELGVSPAARLVLTAGRLHGQKGYEDLLAVLPDVIDGRSDVYFVWAGDGEQRAALESSIRTKGLEDRVRLLGRREDVPRLLQASDLFVLPSRFEGHPFALLEAMAAGVPAVASDAGGAPEIMRDGIDGLIHRRTDTADLARQLAFALDHPAEMARFAGSARERVQEFSRDRMLAETLSLLDELAGR
jgi:glycosyltransferase involved in cell wall biosynthesis